jgi:serine/threonine-protein kinase
MRAIDQDTFPIGPGAELGGYRVVEPLAMGGTGAVVLAEPRAGGPRVALKVLRRELTEDADLLSRFKDEAQAVNRIRHPHIVEVSAFGQTDRGDAFYAMEFLDGKTLAAGLAEQGRLPVERALHITLQLADALAASHAAGIIHRDLKPANVFLIDRRGDPDHVKLVDFGAAKLVGDGPGGQAPRRTRAGVVLGTPFYMAPEQGRSSSGIDARADVYALGVMLYEMLTGEVPYRASNWVGVIIKHQTGPFPRPRVLRPDCPETLEEVLLRAVALERDDRWPDMESLHAALSELLPPERRPAPLARRATTAAPSRSVLDEAVELPQPAEEAMGIEDDPTSPSPVAVDPSPSASAFDVTLLGDGADPLRTRGKGDPASAPSDLYLRLRAQFDSTLAPLIIDAALGHALGQLGTTRAMLAHAQLRALVDGTVSGLRVFCEPSRLARLSAKLLAFCDAELAAAS